jgi:CheY-like chemotaxis protein
MALVASSLSQFNLSESTILVLESTGPELDLYTRILMGFGARKIHKCAGLPRAEEVLREEVVDLIIVDAKLANADGCEFVRQLRNRGGGSKVACIPVMVVAGHTPRNRVTEARDCGAHFVVRKPVSPATMLERILWIAQENRPFVECDAYNGPERRFKTEEVAPGSGRRSNDPNEPLAANAGPDEAGFTQRSATA